MKYVTNILFKTLPLQACVNYGKFYIFGTFVYFGHGSNITSTSLVQL